MEKGNRRGRAILVVGGAGGVGSEVCKHLCRKGKQVIACDNISTGCLSNIEELYTLKNFSFIRSDIADLQIPKGVGTIIFLGYPDKHDADAIFDLNMHGVNNCLDYCADNMCNIIYGSNPVSLSPLDGTSKANAHYLSRQYGESLVSEFYKQYQVGTMVIRIPTVYGKRSIGKNQLIWRLVDEAKRTGSITVVKDQNSVRSYVHYQDLVAMISEAVDIVSSSGFNVVDANGLDVLSSSEVATYVSERISNASGENSAIIYRGRRYSHKRAVSSSAKSILSTRPRIRLNDALGKLIEEERSP
jgi:nucleoside-diphosphate-sugar epimerase